MIIRAFLLLSFTSVTALADDQRAAEFISLGENASFCHINLSPDADLWFQKMYEAVTDQASFDEAVSAAKAQFTRGSTTYGMITYCWGVREKLQSAGFLR